MIQLDNLTKDFALVRAVDDLTLHVPKGVIFGFLGPNGAGKSTTIRMMTGLLKPTWGRVLINEFDLAKKPRYAKREIGYVPDRPFLYDRLSAREFIEFNAQLYLMPQDLMKSKLAAMIEQLEMADWIDERIESYSQGMRQKTAMTAALLHDPPLIILDEPLAGLDPRSARVIKDILKARAASGDTVFFSTHDLYTAEELCDRIAIIDRGKLKTEGSLDDIRSAHGGRLETAFLNITRSEQIIEGAA